MRVNVYAEEMTDRVEVIAKEIEGTQFTGLRIYLELPVTVGGHGRHRVEGAKVYPPISGKPAQVSGPFMHRPGDDDSSAVTFWGKRDLRGVLRKALALLDAHYGDVPVFVDVVFDGPPGPEGGRFVEVENKGASISCGEWLQRDDGYWVLHIPIPEHGEPSMTPAEAVFGVLLLLTTRDEPITFGATHDAAPAAEIADAYCREHGLSREGLFATAPAAVRESVRESVRKAALPYVGVMLTERFEEMVAAIAEAVS